jgi:hypothetical protein
MPFEKLYEVGENKVAVTVSAGWETYGKGRWEFLAHLRVKADGRDYDSIRWSSVTAQDLREAFTYLDKPEWPSSTPPEVLVGQLDHNQLSQIAAEITAYAKQSYPTVDANECYYGI